MTTITHPSGQSSPKRPLGLTLLLTLIPLSNVYGIIKILTQREELLLHFPKLSDPLIGILILIALCSIGSCGLIWRWKKAGLWLMSFVVAAVILTDLYWEAPLEHLLAGLLAFVLLLVFLLPVRNHFN